MNVKTVTVGSVRIGSGAPLCVMAGPCVIESEEHCMALAQRVQAAAQEADLPLIFKASFDKANRSSAKSYRGPGLEAGLALLKEIGKALSVPTVTDIHDVSQVGPAADAVDLLQIPAFLCRQTDLLQAAGASGTPVSIKKGQFMAPGDMRHAVAKVQDAGGDVLLTERGTTFGYNNLVVDMRSLPIMRELGVPKTLALADGKNNYYPSFSSDNQFVVYNRAGGDSYDNPDAALSDGPNMIPVDELADLLKRLKAIHAAAGHE